MQPAQLARLIDRFNKLLDESNNIQTHHISYSKVRSPDPVQCQKWMIQASDALSNCFPEKHPSRVAWAIAASKFGDVFRDYLAEMKGIFAGATQLVRDGYLGTFADAIRAETVGELLDQADDLNRDSCQSAAVGLAGGALETHLRHIADRHGLAIDGHSSIEKLNVAIGQARKAGAEVYTVGDGKLVTAWGDDRNNADHRPLGFIKTEPEVALMIEGIRQFLARNP